MMKPLKYLANGSSSTSTVEERGKPIDATALDEPRGSLTLIIESEKEYRRQESAGLMTVDELYNERLDTSLSRALSLLAEGIALLSEAFEAFPDERLASDDAMLHFHALLKELFACREIGDGYGVVVNSIWAAAENKTASGELYTREQIAALRGTLTQLREEPALTFEHGRKLARSLRSAGLETRPPALDVVDDLLGGLMGDQGGDV
jgi:hypothetical protein